MDNLDKKIHRTERGLTYSYYVSPKNVSRSSNPSLLLLHGFPDNSYMWKDIVSRLLDLPHRILVPDLLGFGDSSKPSDTTLYALKDVQRDISEILGAEDIEKVIAIGHDWGSILGQRLYFHQPELVVGLAMLAVGFMPLLRQGFDLDLVNQATEEQYGYPKFAYFEFLIAPDAPKIISENPEKFWEALHGDEEDRIKKMVCAKGALRKYILSDLRVSLKAYARSSEYKGDFMRRVKQDGFDGPVQWYKAIVSGVQSASDMSLPADRSKLEVPALYIGSSEDVINGPDLVEQAEAAGYLPNLESVTLETGHCSPMESPREVSERLRAFIIRQSVAK